jgi:hypothetical protein
MASASDASTPEARRALGFVGRCPALLAFRVRSDPERRRFVCSRAFSCRMGRAGIELRPWDQKSGSTSCNQLRATETCCNCRQSTLQRTAAKRAV